MKNSKKQTHKKVATPVLNNEVAQPNDITALVPVPDIAAIASTNTTVPVTNVVNITAEGLKLLENAAYVSKGVSVDVIRHAALFINGLSKAEEAKKTNTYSIALLDDKTKTWLRDRCFNYYINYSNKSFHKLYYVKALGMQTKEVYNLKELVEKFEDFLEKTFKDAGIINKEGNICDQTAYMEWYTKCRLYMHEKYFCEQHKAGNLVVLDEDKMRAKTSHFIDELKKKQPCIGNIKRHIKVTTNHIQSVYETALGVKIADDMFAYTVA